MSRRSPDLAAVFRNDDEMMVATPQLVWSCRDHAPAVLEAVIAPEPGLDAIISRMHTELPVPRNWKYGPSGAFFRPIRHARATYLELAPITGTSSSACIAMKGSECVADNFDRFIDTLSNAWSFCTSTIGGATKPYIVDAAMLSALERFPVMEAKPPGVHPAADAVEEAECAADVQREHLARYGELARAPVPLLVFKWDQAVGRRTLEIMRPRLPAKIAKMVEHQIADGLGTYVYHYPSLPLRVGHMQVPDPGRADHVRIPDVGGAVRMDDRMAALTRISNPAAAIEGWLELTARLLAMGYVATDPANLSRGYCVQPQNLVLDGGFVDLNSVRRMDEFPSAASLRFAIMRTLVVLSDSITFFLVGKDISANRIFEENNPEAFAVVREAIFSRLRGEASRGLALHPILEDQLRGGDTLDKLWQTLKARIDLAPRPTQ